MQRDLPRQRGAAAGFTFEAPLESEADVLDGLLAALSRNQVPPEAWSALHSAALRDDRVDLLAQAYASVAQGKRIKTAPAAVAAEFLHQAGVFFSDVAGDPLGSIDYWKRALVASPAHAAAFGRLESALIESGQRRAQADLYVSQAHHRPRAEQAELLRRAVALLEEEPNTLEVLLDQYQEILRLDPRDDETRSKLEQRYIEANRPRDVTRLLEQALVSDPAPESATAAEIRGRLIQLYSGPLAELERCLPHVEALLAEDPEHEEARAAAHRLLEIKALAGRAAAALAQATEATGTPADVLKVLLVELEHTRGPKRRDVLRRLGLLRQDRLGDDAGAYEAFEQALALDASDAELLGRYVGLASSLGKELDAGRALARFGAAARDPQARARLSAEVGHLYLSGGDPKRARASFVAVLAMPELPQDVQLRVSRALCAIYSADRDFRALADALERVALLEPDPEQRQTANEELAELAQTTLRDANRAIMAWRRLVDTPARARALDALEPLYTATGNALELAFVLEERAKDEPDEDSARTLAFRAAEVLTARGDPAAASEAWARFSARFGADRGALAAWIPLLEAQADWQRLPLALEAEASLAPPEEQAALYVRLGQVRLQRTDDVLGAIDAFARALAVDPSDGVSRAALEKLAASGSERLAAGLVLEPYYREEQHVPGVLRVLDLKAAASASSDERMAAILEALEISEASGAGRPIDWVARGLSEAVAARSGIVSWVERLEVTLGPGDARRFASILTRALGDLAADSPELVFLTRRAAEAQVAIADASTALLLYRRALAYDPASPELLARVDELLRAEGTPDERVALYRAALAEGASPERRRELLHTIASIQRHDLGNNSAAIATYETAVAEDDTDRDATIALGDLYALEGRWDSLLSLLERSLALVSGSDAVTLHAQMAEVAQKSGDRASAREHAGAVLSTDATEADIAVVQGVAAALEDSSMLRAAIARRASLAPEPARQIEWLDRLGEVESASGDSEQAVVTWKRAAALAETIGDSAEARRLFSRGREVAPNDVEIAYRLADLLEQAEDWSKLPDVYAVMLAHSELPSVRISVLMRHARLLAEHLDDMASALVSAAQAFELASKSSEYREVLSTFTMLALRGKATHIFAQAMDEAIARNAGVDEESAIRRTDLRMAKARVLAANREGRDTAVLAYRAILEDTSAGETQLKAALHAFEAMLSSEPSDARRADRRWLFAWRVDRAIDEEKATALETWAYAEETIFGDAESALSLYRRSLALDPANLAVLSAVARLSLGFGDAEGAVVALTAQRDHTDGAARSAIEFEIATTLLHRLARPRDALVSVSRLLEAMPDHAGALGLARELLTDPTTRDEMVRVLEVAQEANPKPQLRASILRALLEALRGGAARPDVRGRWYEALLAIQRAGGALDDAFATALAAAEELPSLPLFWDQAEQLARELTKPRDVAEAYGRALATHRDVEVVTFLGERAVAFQEEWFEDPAGVVTILERVLEVDPSAEWAFGRLKMIFDSGERWTELFALYDRTILLSEDGRKAALYEEAAQIAKDFANDSDRAVGYLERLLGLRPTDVHLIASLERLYERRGAHQPLVTLLTQQLASQQGAEAQRTRVRVAELLLDELKDPDRALAMAEEIVRHGAPGDPFEVDAYRLIERVMADAPRGSVTGSERPVRYRAAAVLRAQYERLGRDADLARLFEIELEIATSPEALVLGHRQIANFHAKLGDYATALEHVATLALLEPETASHRAELATLAERVGRYDRLAEVLVSASEKTASAELRAELMLAAGDVWAVHLHDDARATAAYLSVVTTKHSPKLVLEAARKVEPLLERANRAWDLLDVLERLAQLEVTIPAQARAWTLAARLATSLGDHVRAVTAWEARLKNEDSPEALDALVVLLERQARWPELLAILARRAVLPRSPEERRADRIRIARLHQERLGDLGAAIEAWAATEAEFGPTDESTDALCDLLEKTEQWTLLDEKIAVAAARADTLERRAALQARLGDVIRTHRGDAARAKASYEAALATNPREARSRAGLLAIAGTGTEKEDVVRVLMAAYAATDDWQATLELTALRLDCASNDSERVGILLQGAKLAEDRGADLARAYDFISRAFLLTPERDAVAEEFARIAAATGDWRRYAQAHELALETQTSSGGHAATFGDPVWRAAFRYRLGKVKETHLGDLAGALLDYQTASEEAPADESIALAAIELAGRQCLWGPVAFAIVRLSRARNSAAAEALSAAERAAHSSSSWDPLTAALTQEISALPGTLGETARDLEMVVGVWHRDRRGDPDAAEAAFTRALSHDPTNTKILTALANIQRRARGRPLVDSLLRLSSATGGDLDLLREAAEVAISPVADRGLARSILDSLLALAETLWLPVAPSQTESDERGDSPVSVGAPTTPAPIVRWALTALSTIHDNDGRPDLTVELLASAAKLPWEREEARRLLHEAARLARDSARSVDRATQLYEGLVDSDPTDRSAVTALVALYHDHGRNAELLRLQRRLIAGATEPQERIDLRLSSARLELTLDQPDAAIELLRANLIDSPRDPATVSALIAVLEQQGRFRDLGDVLAAQAELAEAAGEPASAAASWVRAAEVAETRLADPDRAVRQYRRALPLEESVAALDAVARLLAAGGDHAGAAEILERLRARSVGADSALLLRFVDQLALAGDSERARQELERACRESPDDATLGGRLAAMYADLGAWEALANQHRLSAARATDKAVRQYHLRAGSELLIHKCRAADQAIPLLEEASALDPEDRTLKLDLAEALVHAERFAEARALLRSIVEGFAGRRPKERGIAHFHLALLEIATGNRTQALAELDAATKIDPGNARILRALAELARADGQVDRAERSYRALLVALKRPEESAEDAEIVRSEVLLELSTIAAGQGQVDRARELVESALESASKSLVEARRLEAGLRSRKDFPTLVRALEARLTRATTDAQRVEVLTELARVLDVELGHLAGAFSARLKILALVPSSDDAHTEILSLARRVDGVARYLDELEQLAASLAREGRSLGASELYFRCGRVLEVDLSDDSRAAAAYERSIAVLAEGKEPEGDRSTPAAKQALAATRALDPIYARLGKTELLHRALTQRVALESPTDDPKSAADARYRLAQVTLKAPDGALEGGLLVRQALDLDPDLARAEDIVRQGISLHPADEGLRDLLETIGRNEGHEQALLDALAARAQAPGASADVAREASAVARRLGDSTRALALLEAYVARHEDRDLGWAFEELAALRIAAGDDAAAVAWLDRAADVAGDADARRIRLDIAMRRESALGDVRGAAAIYERLFEEDPLDRSVSDRMLAAYRQLEDAASLVRLLPLVIDQSAAEDERSRLRLERARLLVSPLARRDEAITALADLVTDDPNHAEAAALLADMFEQSGRNEDLLALLERQVDAAKDRQEALQVEKLSLRRAALLEATDADEARGTLYSALDWTPESRAVLTELDRLLGGPGMEAERLEIKERLLKLADSADAERAALELAELRLAEGNQEGAERAWEIGYRRNPSSRVLQEKLDAAYRAAGATEKLADLKALEARGLAEPGARAAALRAVAELYWQLPDPARAAAALTEAFAAASTDLDLALQLVSALVKAGDLPGAVGIVTQAIESTKDDVGQRATLLLERANLRIEQELDSDAAIDLATVARLGVVHVARALDAELERVRARAEARGDTPLERTVRLQLATVRAEAGDLDAARPLLTEQLRREPKDREALRLLARIEERAERWDAVTVAYRRLIPLEEGDLAVDTALRLADACERAGRLADARGALERTRTMAPHDQALRLRLERLYESVGAFRELAEMSFNDAREASNDETRCAHLKRAGALLLQDGTDTDAAIDALVDAHALSTSDIEGTVLLADAYTVAGRTEDAQALISEQIAARAGRRSPELGSLYHRLARIAHVMGDAPEELRALSSGLDADAQNGFVAAELASLALELGDIEVATRALRAITLLRDASTSQIPKGLAYQYLGEIARQQGDAKRAMLLLKRAIEEDPALEAARQLIDELRAEGT